MNVITVSDTESVGRQTKYCALVKSGTRNEITAGTREGLNKFGVSLDADEFDDVIYRVMHDGFCWIAERFLVEVVEPENTFGSMESAMAEIALKGILNGTIEIKERPQSSDMPKDWAKNVIIDALERAVE